MDLRIARKTNTAEQCTGVLTRGGTWEAWTLEDPVRRDPDPSTPKNEGKIYGRTAIPAGRYRVTITWSPKFKRLMILLNDVPGFTGIRIHGGRDAEDTLGCPLVGHDRQPNGHLLQTLEASAAIRAMVQADLDAGEEVWCDVVNEFPEEDLQ
jgi:hypothetical protein